MEGEKGRDKKKGKEKEKKPQWFECYGFLSPPRFRARTNCENIVKESFFVPGFFSFFFFRSWR